MAAFVPKAALNTLLNKKCKGEDATAFAESVKAFGASCLKDDDLTGDMISVMSDKKNKNGREASMLIVNALVEVCGKSAEPFLAPTMTFSVIEALGDKHKLAVNAAKVGVQMLKDLTKTTAPSASVIIPILIEALGLPKYQSQVAALTWLAEMAEYAPFQLAEQLPALVPLVVDMLNDMRKQTRAAAEVTINACVSIMHNKDVKPIVPEMVAAMKDIKLIPECIQKMAAMTFVQSVDIAVLGTLVPLLARGFKEKNIAVQRCCAVIIRNMSKLVDDPVDARPFLPTLLPALTRASEELADPEARGVCGKAKEQLERIQKAADAAPPAADYKVIMKLFNEIAGKKVVDSLPVGVIEYVCNIFAGLVASKVLEGPTWAKVFSAYVDIEDGDNIANKLAEACLEFAKIVDEDDEDDDINTLFDLKFTLAYGTKILLHNTTMKIAKGKCYGLLGGNDSGKSSLMKEMAKGSIDGYPKDLRTVYVEADIQGEMSHLCCLDYVFEDKRIVAIGCTREEVAKVMKSVGFSEKMLGDAITTLSGGWRMKLALSRAMLQRADILLMDEPTNHLDVLNVAWVEDYLLGLKDVTSIIVSSNSGLLNKCCSNIIHIQDLKLKLFKGKGGLGSVLDQFVEKNPEAKSFFELKSSRGLEFKFPEPGFLDGVKSKGKPLMKMDKVAFTYPINDKPTLQNITVQVSLSSRVACVGVNGAGKSTMIKLLTGELEPCVGSVWKYKGARVAYVAQHAFHHIEQHLDMTPSQYVMWRYANGEDKENLAKVTVKLTEEEIAKQKAGFKQTITNPDTGKSHTIARIIEDILDRKTVRKEFQYLVHFEGTGPSADTWMEAKKLEKLGFEKLMKQVDVRVEAREGSYRRALTREDIEAHFKDVGLDAELTTHTRMSTMSGGQKVKVVLGAAVWMQPHIIILDEPTNYLDRESLGALAVAITNFGGGVVIISHNDQFCSTLCPETWVLENGTLNCKGDAAWMKNALKEKVEFKMIEEMTDALGNTIKVKQPKKKLTRKQLKARARRRKAALAMGEELSDSDSDYE